MNAHLKLAYDWGCQAAMEKWAVGPEWVMRKTIAGMESRFDAAVKKDLAEGWRGAAGQTGPNVRKMHLGIERARGRSGLATKELLDQEFIAGGGVPGGDLHYDMQRPNWDRYKRIQANLDNREVQMKALDEFNIREPRLDPNGNATYDRRWGHLAKKGLSPAPVLRDAREAERLGLSPKPTDRGEWAGYPEFVTGLRNTDWGAHPGVHLPTGPHLPTPPRPDFADAEMTLDAITGNARITESDLMGAWEKHLQREQAITPIRRSR